MGFRFRKSFGSGPFRVNVSKSGVGYSFGGKGFRYTKKAGGGSRTTASIPDSGISYTKESSREMGKRKSTGESRKGGGCATWIVVLLILSAIGSCASGGSNGADETIPPASTNPIVTTAPFETTETPTEPSETTQATTTPTETTAPPETTEVPTEVATEPTVETEAEHTYVLNTNTHKFHYPSCSSVDNMKDANKETYTGTRSGILARGYEPCGRCDP